MNKEKEPHIEWGTWICPACGDECQDPETVASTTCHNGHGVYLSRIDGNGSMEATLQDNTNHLIHTNL